MSPGPSRVTACGSASRSDRSSVVGEESRFLSDPSPPFSPASTLGGDQSGPTRELAFPTAQVGNAQGGCARSCHVPRLSDHRSFPAAVDPGSWRSIAVARRPGRRYGSEPTMTGMVHGHHADAQAPPPRLLGEHDDPQPVLRRPRPRCLPSEMSWPSPEPGHALDNIYLTAEVVSPSPRQRTQAMPIRRRDDGAIVEEPTASVPGRGPGQTSDAPTDRLKSGGARPDSLFEPKDRGKRRGIWSMVSRGRLRAATRHGTGARPIRDAEVRRDTSEGEPTHKQALPLGYRPEPDRSGCGRQRRTSPSATRRQSSRSF